MTKNKGFSTLLIVSGTVFFSNACIMIVELVASRLIARHLGSSLYTWTSIIGIVLAGISVGNYFGGRLADKYHPRKTLSLLFCLASVACVTIILLNNIVGEWTWLWQLSWPVRVFSHVTLVFLLPSMLLGTISPVAATMALKSGLPTGRTIGEIYAWGTAGSIAGTFLAGFYLIATLGTVAIVWTIAGALLLMGIIYYAKMWVLYVWMVIFALLLTLGMAPYDKTIELGGDWNLREKYDPTILYNDETPYCHVRVRQLSTDPDRREFLQDKLRHSEINMEDITKLYYFYTEIFGALTDSRINETQTLDAPSFLIIGGGGFVFPQYLQHAFPGNSRVDVAEIDPGVTEAAHAAFGLPRDTPINAITLDARNHIDDVLYRNKTSATPIHYDFIYEDAINDYSVPFQLVTQEFNEKIVQLLSEDGLYLINLIDTYDNGRFLGAIVNTLRKTFPAVYVLTNKESFPELRDTFVVAAGRKPFDPRALIQAHNPQMAVRIFDEADYAHIDRQSRGMVLTDDFAPVENLLTPVVKQSAKELLAARYLGIARRLKADGKADECIDYYRKAASKNPSMTTLCYNEIGTIIAGQNKPQEAIGAFQKAIDYFYANQESSQKNIGSIHLNLGILLGGLGQPEKAVEQLKLAVERFTEEIVHTPTDPVLYSRLGDAHAMMAQFKEASEAFAAAHRLDPSNHIYYGNLIRSLELQGRFDEAIGLIKEQIGLLRQQGNRASAAQLEQYLQGLEQQRKSSPQMP
jgi:tetratricopeptide (TPR) repeat protein/MFS family permease